MRKNISLYGIGLLTLMVILRAATMQPETETDTDRLFSRSEEAPAHLSTNLTYRNWQSTPAVPVLTAIGTIHKVEAVKTNYPANSYAGSTTFESLANQGISDDLIQELIQDSAFVEDLSRDDISVPLDGKSTINTNLSLLFPRKKINPRPTELKQ